MKYRPEYALMRIRNDIVVDDGQGQRKYGKPQNLRTGETKLRLCWLRSWIVDCKNVPNANERSHVHLVCEFQRRSVIPQVIEWVLLRNLRDTLTVRIVLRVKSLDLRCCANERVVGKFVSSFVKAASPSIVERLLLPDGSNVKQSTFDHFTSLTELHVPFNTKIKNVHFCASTLRILFADFCEKLSDEGLLLATRLQVLHVRSCSGVTSVAPFAHCLRELNAAGTCGIKSAALSLCSQIYILNVEENINIETLQPFAHGLRELNAGGWLDSSIEDTTLAEAVALVKLDVSWNPQVTTVVPFASTLIELNASASPCGLSDAGLINAVNLTCLNASENEKITTVSPFAETLLELDASGDCQIDDQGLYHATKIIRLDVTWNRSISTVTPFGRSLRHLVAIAANELSDSGISSAVNLVTLDCSINESISSMTPFLKSLEELIAHGLECALRGAVIPQASRLHTVWPFNNQNILPDNLASFTPVECGEITFYCKTADVWTSSEVL